MLLEKERIDIIEYGKKMLEDKLTNGTSGNISVFNRELGLIAISPSGIDYYDTKPEDIVIVDLDGNIVEGSRKPSSELELHLSMYRIKENCSSVVHTHSMYCTIFASLRQSLKSVHYLLADAGVSEVMCAEYETYGTKALADSAARTIGKSEAVLLANHGMLACGKDVSVAYSIASAMEYCAELQYRCMCIGKPVILEDDEMEKIVEKFKSYGQ